MKSVLFGLCGWVAVVVEGKLSVCLGFDNPLQPQELNSFFSNQKLRYLPNEVTSASRGFWNSRY